MNIRSTARLSFLGSRSTLALATASLLALSGVAHAEPCGPGSGTIVCSEVDVKGKVYVDGVAERVRCKASEGHGLSFEWSGAPGEPAIAGLLQIVGGSDACDPLLASIVAAGDGSLGFTFLLGFEPDRVVRNGVPKDQCTFHTAYLAGYDDGGDDSYSASLAGTWKFDDADWTPTRIKADLASRAIKDGASAHFFGNLTAKGCVLEPAEE